MLRHQRLDGLELSPMEVGIRPTGEIPEDRQRLIAQPVVAPMRGGGS